MTRLKIDHLQDKKNTVSKAAVWEAGNTTIPLAAGAAHGTAFQETVIQVILYSAAPIFFISMGLILWGLRMVEARPTNG